MPKSPTFPDCFDEVKTITIAWLRQRGFLQKGHYRASGSLHWTRAGRPSGSVAAIVDTIADAYLELDYLSNGKPIKYRVRLEGRTSNLGKGTVLYFICPATGRRCRTLYGIGDYFLSRFAYPSAMYSNQTESKRWRGYRMVLDALDRESPFDRKYSRTHYKDRPTKRFRRWLARTERRERTVLEQRLINRFFE